MNRNAKHYFKLFFFVIILFVITGISTPVIGALVRYKVPGLIFIIIIINLLYDALKKNHSNRLILIFLIIWFKFLQ